MNRNNVVMDKRGKLHNLREDLPEKERYITQIVTVKKANTVIMSGTLVFRIETYEDEIININLHKEKDISILFNVFSMLEAESEEDMEGKEIIRYLDIHFCTFGMGVIKDNKVKRVIRLVDFANPRNEEQLIHQHIGYLPSDEEWKKFCQNCS